MDRLQAGSHRGERSTREHVGTQLADQAGGASVQFTPRAGSGRIGEEVTAASPTAGALAARASRTARILSLAAVSASRSACPHCARLLLCWPEG